MCASSVCFMSNGFSEALTFFCKPVRLNNAIQWSIDDVCTTLCVSLYGWGWDNQTRKCNAYFKRKLFTMATGQQMHLIFTHVSRYMVLLKNISESFMFIATQSAEYCFQRAAKGESISTSWARLIPPQEIMAASAAKEISMCDSHMPMCSL